MHGESSGSESNMKKLIKTMFVMVCGALLVACFALVGCGSSTENAGTDESTDATETTGGDYTLQQDGVLTVITSADYPPMEYMDGDEIVGFDPAMMTEIANRMGLEVQFKNQAFDTLVTAVAGGTGCDVAVSAITIDPDRSEEVDFTDSYYDSNLAIVVLDDGTFTASDDIVKVKEQLAGQAVGAQSGSSGEAWVQENLTDSDYTPQQDTPDLLQQLRTGAIKAAVYDQPVAEAHVAGEYSDCMVMTVIPTGEQYGIIVNKDNPELTSAINDVLAEMKDDGTLQALYAEYLG